LPYGEVGGGVAPAILGSLYLIIVACIIGLPLAVLTAIYLSEYAYGRFGDAVRFVIDLLAGLPSIVVGVFVWILIVINTGSFSGLAGAVALAIIMRRRRYGKPRVTITIVYRIEKNFLF
jgi:phosphate transport system permease protein